MSDFWATFGVDLHLELDPAAGRRGGLEAGLRGAIRSGRLAPGTRLPSTRTLAGEIGLARGTVTAVYDQLTAEGYLIARRGSGTEVAALTSSPAAAPPNPRGPSEPRHNLLPGRPDVSAFPTAAWLRAYRRALNAAPAAAYGYGDPAGRIELRTALADYLGRTRGVSASPDHIVITSGYVQSLALLSRVLRDMGVAAMAMEDPGLPFHRDVVTRAGMPITALPVDDHGARADLLTTAEHARTGAVVVTPAHQYPAGATLHPSRRHALAQWARTTGAVIVEDDYDGEFFFGGQPLPTLKSVDTTGLVLYVGTFSKSLFPSLRLGYLLAPPALVDIFEKIMGAFLHGVPSYLQAVVAEFIDEGHFATHLRRMRRVYAERHEALREAARAKLGGTLDLVPARSGLHTVGHLAAHLSELEVARIADKRGVIVSPIARFAVAPISVSGLVLGFGSVGVPQIKAGIDVLAGAMESLSRRKAL